jgi:hypothetical protein
VLYPRPEELEPPATDIASTVFTTAIGEVFLRGPRFDLIVSGVLYPADTGGWVAT